MPKDVTSEPMSVFTALMCDPIDPVQSRMKHASTEDALSSTVSSSTLAVSKSATQHYQIRLLLMSPFFLIVAFTFSSR